MAQRTVLIDDLDEKTEGAETITYMVDGTEYQIDLSQDNVDKFRKALEPFVSKSRTVTRDPVMQGTSGRGGRGRRRSSAGGSGRNRARRNPGLGAGKRTPGC